MSEIKMPAIDDSMTDREIRDTIWESITGQIPVLVRQMAAEGIFPTDDQVKRIASALRDVYRAACTDTLIALGRLPQGSDARH